MLPFKKTIFYALINLFIIPMVKIDGKFLKEETTEGSKSIAKCLVAIANSEYRKPTVVIVGDGNKKNISTENMQVQILTKVFTGECIPQIIINDFHYLRETLDKYQENLLIVILVDNCEFLGQFQIFTKKFKYLIILNEILNEECNKDFEEIRRTLQHRDVTFIFKELQQAKYKLQTTLPEIDENTCQYDDITKSTVINTCTNGTLEGRLVFPVKKPKNLKNCPLNVGMATMFPYSIIEKKDSLKNLEPIKESQIRGSDLEIIKIISNYFNATLNFYYIYREEESPYLHLEYIPFLLNGSFDVCAGGLYRIYGDLVYYSGIYNRQVVIWVYAVERDSRSWQTIVCKINGLYIFVLFYFCYSVIWILFCKFDNIVVSSRNIFLNSWGALIGTASLQDSRTWKQKMLNISYLTLCLHLSVYISVQFYSFFTIQGPPQALKTNDDVMESGRTPYLNYETKFFVEDSKYIAFANTSENCANFQDCEDKTIDYKGLTVIPEGYFYSFQASTAVDNEARVLRASENIVVLYHEMIARKDSPFSGKFDKIVKRLFEAGICNRLYLEAIGLLVAAKAESANSNIMANSYSCESGCAITISQIAGALYVWMLGCFISFFAFVIEVRIKQESKIIITSTVSSSL